MLGEWVNESDDGIVKTNCKWSDDGNFLLREFDVKVEGRIALRGTQRIGWDAQRKQFRMWVFDDRGGFAEGLLSRDGERWITKASGVRSDGQSVSITTAITPLGKDRILWETLERTVGGEAVPGTDQYLPGPPCAAPRQVNPHVRPSPVHPKHQRDTPGEERWYPDQSEGSCSIAIAFAFVIPPAFAGRGGRGGGGGARRRWEAGRGGGGGGAVAAAVEAGCRVAAVDAAAAGASLVAQR